MKRLACAAALAGVFGNMSIQFRSFVVSGWVTVFFWNTGLYSLLSFFSDSTSAVADKELRAETRKCSREMYLLRADVFKDSEIKENIGFLLP